MLILPRTISSHVGILLRDLTFCKINKFHRLFSFFCNVLTSTKSDKFDNETEKVLFNVYLNFSVEDLWSRVFVNYQFFLGIFKHFVEFPAFDFVWKILLVQTTVSTLRQLPSFYLLPSFFLNYCGFLL